MIDLRSDTVTRPTDAMRAAIAAAEVGDDLFADDPTVNRLQDRVAELTGKQAALFVASGTQSNLAGVLAHCGRGDALLIGRGYHVVSYEGGGTAALGGVFPYVLDVDDRAGLTPEAIHAAIPADDPHFPQPVLLCLENTVGGMVQPLDALHANVAAAREHGLTTHLDGARLWNAVVATGTSVRDWVAPFDTVSLCFSKGLGAPVGSVLAGPADVIARAHRIRKMLGGAMRQAGVLAAAALHALDHHVERLADDHARAERLAKGIVELGRDDLRLVRQDTNVVMVGVDAPEAFGAHLAAHGITVLAGPTTRLVLHLDVSDDDVDTVLSTMASFTA